MWELLGGEYFATIPRLFPHSSTICYYLQLYPAIPIKDNMEFGTAWIKTEFLYGGASFSAKYHVVFCNDSH